MVDLCTLIQATGSSGGTDYANIKTVGPKILAYPNENSTTFIPFYRAPSIENVIEKSDFNTSTGWNREHTWPKSRGGGSFEGDPVIIRPSAVADNSARGNNYYGLSTDAGAWDPAKDKNGKIVNEAARGESARIILYAAVTYHTLVSLNNDPNGSKTMGYLRTLLQWNRDYAPQDWEKTVNDRTDKLGYRRNPFVDHPEYADLIWDANGLRTSPLDIDVPVTPDPETPTGPTGTQLTVIENVADLDGKTCAIMSTDSGAVWSMTAAGRANTPWYIDGKAVTLYDGKYYVDSDPDKFSFQKQGNGKFIIENDAGEHLFGYQCTGTDGKSHTSIGWGDSEEAIKATQSTSTFTTITDEWNITAMTGGFVVTTGAAYLEYYRGSFCGYNKAPGVPILFAY